MRLGNPRPLRVALFTDARGWHEARLREAFNANGAECVPVPLHECRLHPSRDVTSGFTIPGFEDALPDAAFVRGINAGSFEQVTFRLTVLHALREAGVIVYNPARAIERTVDKGMTSWLLTQADIPTPPAWTCESHEYATEIVRREVAAGERIVVKPLFGSRGQGLALIDTHDALPAPESVNGAYHLQRFMQPAAHDRSGAPMHEDWRVMVVGGRAVAAMRRRSKHWITNRARGAECVGATPTGEPASLAIAAAHAVGANYAGVDLLVGADGRPQVLEVNGVPAFKGLQQSCETDVALALASDLVRVTRAAQSDGRMRASAT